MGLLKATLPWIHARPLRFYASVLVLASLPLGLFLLLAHEILLRQVKARLVTQSSQTGKLIGNILEQHVQECSAVLHSYAGRQDLIRDAAAGHWDSLAPHLEQARALRPDFSSFSIYDLNGVLRSTHPPNLHRLGSLVRDPQWLAAMASDKALTVSEALQSPLNKDAWVIALAAPLKDPKGKVVGYLVGEQSLDDMTRKIYSLTSASSTTLISFMDQNGRTFARFGKQVKVFPARPEVTELLRKKETGKGTIIRVGNEDFLVAYTPLPGLRWGMYIQAPMAALQPALWAYEKNIAFASLFLLALILAGSGFVASLYRKISRQNIEIERASQMKSRFMASMSHEIRTPLNAILGFTALLEESTLASKQQRWAGHIHRAGLHLLQLVNDILDLSKIEAGQIELKWEPFSLEGALPEVTSVLAPLAAKKHIEPHILVENGLLIYADRIRFKQILYNLMSNAIKFTPEGGSVEVKAVAAGSAVEVSVADTGVGIDERDQELIFEEFEQVGDALTSGEGTGLGLAITKKLVEQHGGSIKVHSRRGHGSTFTLTLPRGNPASAFSATHS
ncbi:MAG TPA: sensor histidine kinase [Terriglobales bacterium]|nr:sensor histidine kinase [Terriglobales bacterium]